jgi:hypothetical protein
MENQFSAEPLQLISLLERKLSYSVTNQALDNAWGSQFSDKDMIMLPDQGVGRFQGAIINGSGALLE